MVTHVKFAISTFEPGLIKQLSTAGLINRGHFIVNSVQSQFLLTISTNIQANESSTTATWSAHSNSECLNLQGKDQCSCSISMKLSINSKAMWMGYLPKNIPRERLFSAHSTYNDPTEMNKGDGVSAGNKWSVYTPKLTASDQSLLKSEIETRTWGSKNDSFSFYGVFSFGQFSEKARNTVKTPRLVFSSFKMQAALHCFTRKIISP